MDIKILGKGCAKCLKLEAMTRETLAALGRTADVAHVTDLDAIMKFPIMSTPALVIDGVVRSEGHLPRREDLAEWLQGPADPGPVRPTVEPSGAAASPRR